MAIKDDYVTVSQFAHEYGTTADTVRRWIRSGKLPAFQIPPAKGRGPEHDTRQYWIPRNYLDDFLVPVV